ncbi:MAG: glycosyltransferase family 4 protein [Candidatus Bathyarchaeia archaeon]
MLNTVLLVTVEQVPKPGRGGPGAVIDNLVKELISNPCEYGWLPIVVSNPCVRETHRHSLLTLLPSFIKSLIERLRNTPIVGYVLCFLITEIRLIQLFSLIHRFEKLLRMNYDKIKNAHVIHAHDIYSLIALSKVLCDHCKFKPILLSIHSPGSTSRETLKYYPEEEFTRFGKYLKFYELYAIWLSTALIMPSKGALSLLMKDQPLIQQMRKKTYILYNGIKPLKTTSRDLLRKKLNLSSKDILIIGIGRLATEKGFDILIKATKYLDRELTNVHVVIVGDGMQRKVLEDLVELLDLKSKVHFLGHVKDISYVYSAADIFVSSARRSALDLVILEALSAGLPIVATDVGGNREAIGDAGVIIEPDDPKTLAKAIIKLIKNEGLRRKLSLRAQKRFKELFHIKSMVHSYIQILNEIVS